jgi:hypothetical protein
MTRNAVYSKPRELGNNPGELFEDLSDEEGVQAPVLHERTRVRG